MNFFRNWKKRRKGNRSFWNSSALSFANTLETTLKVMEDGTVYVITGDIPAMWLRDSTAQIRPYLFLGEKDEKIKDLIAGLVKRQFFYICLDPYANAFNEGPTGACWEKDDPDQSPWVWERKFEIDSLCYPVQLAWLLWKNTGCTAQFDENFRKGVWKILDVFQTEQNHEEKSSYVFIRKGSYYSDTLSREGKGALVRPDIGLIWSGFRPSDDACTYGYLIPSNMFAVVVLGYLEEIAEKILRDESLRERAGKMKAQVQNAIEIYGRVKTEEFGTVYAYEVDGYGMVNLMDDANVPSLLSMSYLGYPADRETMENTRKMILSEGNPYYYKGKAASGIGSPHTPSGYIWPIALAMEGLTSNSREEKKRILDTLVSTTGGTGMIHEGFSADNPEKYTREWFSWANAMYGELFLDYLGYRLKV
ncbi:MAG TPA: glycoside hydrolase family 125 protein [Candidatus Blautia stercoripullorum]|uniref:Glycoside hydrolase family 125 protein n=1 Tax=Candidatus Blautia stercoripullorum TaxID=2838502 RepID=A0A9D2R6H0_9FIRM|nr:glycoside hydrolase family 125 protein [Candidatus Blautia stercoripullorum]